VIIKIAAHEASSSAMALAEKDEVWSRFSHDWEQPCVHVYRHISDLLQIVYEYDLWERAEILRTNLKYQRTFLHVAVIANSEKEVQRLLDLTKAYPNENDYLHRKYFTTVEVLSGFTAYRMARVVGNERILQMIATATGITRICGNTPTPKGATSVVGANDREKLQMDVEKIGKVLKSHLEQLEFPDSFLKIVSLGDEFRLHASLTTGDPGTFECWMDYHEPNSNNIAKLLRGLISDLAKASVLSTFLQLRDSAGRCILHYLADFSQIGYADPRGDAVRRIIFTTFMNELESEELKSHVPEDYMNCEDNVGRTPLHLAVAQGFKEIVERFAENPETNLNATFVMSDEKSGKPDDDIHRDISALSLAVAHNHFNIVKSLCKTPTGRLDVNWRTATEIRLLGRFNERYFVRWSPLQLAAFKGHVETLEILLKQVSILQP
jgi:ankyrin repeat protein